MPSVGLSFDLVLTPRKAVQVAGTVLRFTDHAPEQDRSNARIRTEVETEVAPPW